MKNFIYLFLCILLVGCSSDDDNTESQSILIITEGPISILSKSVIIGGSLKTDVSTKISAKGICWGTSSQPTLANNHTDEGTENKSYVSTIEGLNPTTEYFARAYVTTESGTTYGNEIKFTTINSAQITTNEVTDIYRVHATSGGSVINPGDQAIIARGICWDTAPMPTIANMFTDSAPESGDFISIMEGLTGETKYYVRAYVTTNEGTFYGNEVSFTTDDLTYDGDIEFTRKSQLISFGKNDYTIINGNVEISSYYQDDDVPDSDKIYTGDLVPLNTIEEITGDFTTKGETYGNFTGLENLSHIGGSYYYRNIELFSFSGLEGLKTIDGDFDFSFYPLVGAYNFDGFDNLTTIGGSFIIEDFLPNDLDALSKLRSIGGDLKINYLDANKVGLNNLTTIGGSLKLDRLYNSNLEGLQTLNQLGEDIIITFTEITNYCAIENLVLNGQYQSLIISDNYYYNPTIEDFENGDCSQ